jgi:AsmA family/AsmA-like C-terminal region
MSDPAPVDAHRNARRNPGFLRWLALGLAVAIVAAAVLLPLININRYHRSIAESLSRSLGRPIHMGSAKLQLLPRPGLAISDFVVEEDPAFGAEPLLRAPSVTVSLRLMSLWRGPLEVSRIDLDSASLNLVRDPAGRWNFGPLLIQAARIPNAPTALRHAAAAPRFPYIEFREARINFKQGNEKKPFAFLNSDLSIWMAEADQWQLRLEAQPARTDLDLDLADTGLMRLEGSLNRASALDQMPMKLHAEWNGAALGQVSRLILGNDSGWRGDLRAEADIVGDLRNLTLQTRLRVDDAHLQEFTPLTPLNIDAKCRGLYRNGTHSIDDLTCLWPAGNGHLLLTGDIQNLPEPGSFLDPASQMNLDSKMNPTSHLALEINHAPVSFAVSVLGLLRRGQASSPRATGLMNGRFEYASDRPAALTGQVDVDSVTLSLPGIDKPLVAPTLHFTTPELPTAPRPAKRAGHGKPHAGGPPSTDAAILLQTAPLSLGAVSPVQISGQFTRSGFALRMAGEADLERLTALSRSIGLLRGQLGTAVANLTSQQPGQSGTADLDLSFAGPWMTPVNESPASDAGATTTLGWLRVSHAQAKLDWLPEPVLISTATANFSSGKATWSNASFSVNGINARGSSTYPLHCDITEACTGHFNLEIPTLDAAALESALMGAGRHGELLSTILAQVERKTAPWPQVDGTVHVGSVAMGSLVLRNVRGSLGVHGNHLEIASLDSETLGGSLHANGSVEASGNRPLYTLNLTWTGVDLSQSAATFHESWGTGTMNGGAKVTLAGYSASDFASSAHGAFHWEWRNGSLSQFAPLEATSAPDASSTPRVTQATDEPPLAEAEEVHHLNPSSKFAPEHFTRWTASGLIDGGLLKLPAADQANPVTGTIGFDRKLDLLWPTSPQDTLHVGGSLAHPVLSAPATAR